MDDLTITIKRSNKSGAVSITVENELPGDREIIFNHLLGLTTKLAGHLDKRRVAQIPKVEITLPAF